jgi:hypothetical protein
MCDNPYQSPQSDLTPADLPPRKPGDFRLEVLPGTTRRTIAEGCLLCVTPGLVGFGVSWMRNGEYWKGLAAITAGVLAMFAALRGPRITTLPDP